MVMLMSYDMKNSLGKNEEPVYLRIKPSLYLASFLMLFFLTAAFILTRISVSVSVQILLSLILAAGLYRSLSVHVLLNTQRSILRLVWETSGRWRVWDGIGQEYDATLIREFVHSKLIVLGLKFQNGLGHRSVLLLPDSLDPDSLKKLRHRLKDYRIHQQYEDDDG